MTLNQNCLAKLSGKAVSPPPEPESDRDEFGEITVIKKTRYGRSTNVLSFVVGVAAIAAALAAQPVAAQQFGGGTPSSFGGGSTPMLAPGLRMHAVNPSMSLSAPAASPLQQQTQDDYATGLMDAQRQLLQQNPSGDSRSELSIGSQLNGFTGPR
jgi:hypothetical protein